VDVAAVGVSMKTSKALLSQLGLLALTARCSGDHVGGAVPEYRALQDTINIPGEQTVTIRLPLEGHAGTWMFHCHILEHAERGMMGELHVVEP